MANKIFKSLLDSEIEKFKASFSNLARSLFYNEEKRDLSIQEDLEYIEK